MEQNESTKHFDCWAIIELFGHNKIAGRLTTQTVGVAALFRVDVPELLVPEVRESGHEYLEGKYRNVERVLPEHKRGGYTRFFGVGAIYAINPVTEETARAAVIGIEPLPVRPRLFPIEKALPAPPTEATEYPEAENNCCPNS